MPTTQQLLALSFLQSNIKLLEVRGNMLCTLVFMLLDVVYACIHAVRGERQHVVYACIHAARIERQHVVYACIRVARGERQHVVYACSCC